MVAVYIVIPDIIIKFITSNVYPYGELPILGR